MNTDAAMLSATPSVTGLHLSIGRRWLVSDTWVSNRLTSYPVAPIADKTLLRHARLVAFVLGVRALPAAGAGSIARVPLLLDLGERSQLARQLKMPNMAVDEAVRHLLLAGVLEPVLDGTHHASFAEPAVSNSPLASAVYWPIVLERLLSSPREGSQAALILFRILADRVPHPEAPVGLSLRELGEELGLGEAQIRRGIKALVAAQCCSENAINGRVKQYAIHPSVRWHPGAGETIAVTSHVPSIQTKDVPSIPTATAEPRRSDTQSDVETPVTSSEPDWVLVLPRGMQFTLPPTAQAADLTVDAAGQLVIRLRAGLTGL